MGGRFRLRRGRGYEPDQLELKCNKKLCFFATDQALLTELLFELMERPDAWAAKYSTCSKGGMYLGRAFFTDEETVGRLWRGFKRHPELFCAVQDDDWSGPFRDVEPILL